MNRKFAILITILMLALPLFTLAQDPKDSKDSTDQKEQEDTGRIWGDYKVHQSIELGGRIVDSKGSQQIYNTFVNEHSGPRLLGMELSMQSISHQGLLFDNLYVSSFGFGGDPEAMARLRMQKHKWYNFVGLYRRDRNYFDYNLFGNPLDLNAGSTTCGGPVGGPPSCVNSFTPSALFWFTNSPHSQFTTRNMGDFSLTLLPESAVSFRLGYARNNTHGIIDTTLEAPLQSLLTEESGWRSDRYQFGVDVKLLPRTTIRGDVFFEHDKNDFAFLDNNLLYRLGNATGPLIDPGIMVPPLSGAVPTCAGANTVSINPSGFFIINNAPGCAGVLLNTGPGGPYFKRGNVRTDIPTGQLSLQSNYFHNLEFTASGTYSAATSDFLNFTEFMHGAVPRLTTAAVADLNSGVPTSKRVSGNADLGVTYHISKNWSVSDKFRWANWRNSGGFTNTLFRCLLPNNAPLATPTGFPGGTVTLTPFTNPCVSDILALTAMTTSGNAAAGSIYEQVSTANTLLGERSYFNTAKLNFQPSRHFGGYIGYRFGRRDLRLGDLGFPGSPNFSGTIFSLVNLFANTGTGAVPTVPTTTTFTGAVAEEQINQHTFLFGVMARPLEAWRINADVELTEADNSFTDISPRHQQRMRFYTTYKPRHWINFNGGLHFVETGNDFAPLEVVDGTATPLFPTTGAIVPYGHKDHWRYYTFGVGLNPNSKVTFDLGWTLLDQEINSSTCMPLPANVFTGLVAPTACANGATARALLLHYVENTNSGYTSLSYQPVKRLTLNLGYEVTADNGRTDWLRMDTGQLLQVVGDVFGNSPPLTGNAITPCPGASVAAGCVFPGPFVDQPIGPQAINWHKINAGLAVEVTKGVQLKGLWSYYDYNAKDEVPALLLLQVTAPRGAHANVGTLSLKYSF